jgi:hypothetical protein
MGIIVIVGCKCHFCLNPKGIYGRDYVGFEALS